MTPLPGCTPTKPGSACFPFFGVVAVILDEAGKVWNLYEFKNAKSTLHLSQLLIKLIANFEKYSCTK